MWICASAGAGLAGRSINVGESEAQKLRRLQQNGNSAMSWEEKELLERIIKASAMHAGVKELAESFKKHKEEIEKELEEELAANRVGNGNNGHGKNAYGLPNNLASMSHKEQVHHLTEHFMHGGSVDDLEKSGYLSKKQAEEVKATNRKIEEEVEAAWKEKEERMRAEGKSQREIEEEKARFKAKETEARLRKESEDAKARGEMHVANTLTAQANQQAMEMKEKSSYEATTTRGVRVESDKLKNNLVEAKKLQDAKNSGVELTAEQNKTVVLKNILEEKDFSKKLKAQREIKEELAAKLYKKDATDLEKVAALEAVKSGVVTQGVVDESKAVEENSEKKVEKTVASVQKLAQSSEEDVFGNSETPKINKSYLAAKREEAVNSTSTQKAIASIG